MDVEVNAVVTYWAPHSRKLFGPTAGQQPAANAVDGCVLFRGAIHDAKTSGAE
jgi:hypothetical protein